MARRFRGGISFIGSRIRRKGADETEYAGQRGASDSRDGQSAGVGLRQSAEFRRSERRSTARDVSRPEAERAKPSRAPKIAADDWLDLDRKLDLIGVGLVFGAIVFLFSALSPEQGAIGGLHRVIGQLLGWGAFAVPAAMFATGLWLIVRHFGDEPPVISLVRLAGAALAFLAALILFQYIESFGYPERCGNACIESSVRDSYQAGRGGGLLGGWAYSALVINLTELGGFVAVVMALTIAAMLTTRSSIVELAVIAISLSRNIRTRLSQAATQRRAARLQSQQQLAMAQEGSHVRVRKPQPAQLNAAPAGGPALPAPKGDWMPIPTRLKAIFGARAKASPDLEAEAVPLESGISTSAGGMMKRLLSRRGRDEAQADKPERGGIARLEKFLNLGDDLSADAASASTKNPTSAPKPSQAAHPPYGIARQAPPRSSLAAAAQAPANIPEKTPSSPPARPAESPAAPSGKAMPGHEIASRPAERPPVPSESKPKQPAARLPSPRVAWDMPDYRELLNAGTASELDQEALREQARIIEETLKSFGAPGRVIEVNSGPVITQYGVEPAYITARTGKRSRVKVGAIAKLDKDLQLALGARSLRMEAPVPGKGYVGIEVPNPASARVGLRDVMESSAYQRIDSPLAIALGMSVDGKPIAADLTQMPHMLIAGTTGSGKSVCVNAIINSILVNNSPETARFIMVDPKRVELTGYNGLPHLVAPVVVELERIIGVLRWVTTEMDERYKKFSQAGARNIIDYNSILDPDLAAMPYIVVVIDELADLMMMAPDDTERAIARIAALARATGIHLIIATQRPSVDVVTGLIKANCPARIAFAVAGSVDSRVIIDQPGAERLLGKGDMLYLSGDTPAPQRVQGVHVSNEEIRRISMFWKLQGVKAMPETIALPPKSSPERGRESDAPSRSKANGGSQAAFWKMPTERKKSVHSKPDEDELYQTAVDMVRRLEKASVSLLQRRLRIGYTRAARLIDMMEERGVVGPPKEGSSKPRDVLPG